METAIGLVSGSSGAVLSGGSFQRVREFGKEVDWSFLEFFSTDCRKEERRNDWVFRLLSPEPICVHLEKFPTCRVLFAVEKKVFLLMYESGFRAPTTG